ncbi:MAG: metallophosphoesterase family protein [Candidatus Helarchaeota archaeon]
MTNFKIYAISDLHSSMGKVQFASKVIKQEKPDIVVICGDISHSSRADRLKHVISLLDFAPIYFVLGNMDGQNINVRISNAFNLHLKCKNLFGYYFCGFGGPSDILNEVLPRAPQIVSGLDPNKIILITHVPPRNHCDRVYSGKNVGNTNLRKFIVNLQPRMLLCGHIHEDRGISKLGNTTIINVGAKGCIIQIDEDDIIKYRLIS